MPSQYPDLRSLEGVVHPAVLDAMYKASALLSEAGITHALAGALAVGAWGYPRHSKDVDFLVGPEGFHFHEGGIVTLHDRLPVAIGDVAVDPLSASESEPFLEASIAEAITSEGVPVLPLEALVYMKIKSPRRKDQADIVELVKAGVDTDRVGKWLMAHAPSMADKFAVIVAVAEEEESAEG